MSSIEERLTRDIAAMTGGVVVTDSDLRIARRAVEDRIADRTQRGRRLAAITVAAAVVLVLILGAVAWQSLGGDTKTAPPADNGPTATGDPDAAFLTGSAPTPDLLEGIWRLDNGGVLLRFASPDLISFDRSGRLFEDPSVHGRYAIDGGRVTVTIDGGPSGCGGQQLTMRASVPEPGVLNIVYDQSGAGECAMLRGERWVMEQVLPPGPVFTEIELSADEGATWNALTQKDMLPGSWFAEKSDYVLELATNGEYHVAAGAGEQVDYGEWSLQGSQLTLTSWPDSAQCEGFDELALAGMEYYAAGTTVVRSTVRKNDCRAPWADAVWFRIPDDSTR